MKKSTDIKGHWWILICIGIIGLAFVFYGSTISDPVIIAVGGASLGGSISSVIAKYDGYLFQEKTLNVIQTTLTAKFISNENKVNRFRKKWHVYYATKSNGKHDWRYVIWDFQKQSGLGVLSGSYITYDHDGEECEYYIEAGVRDQRLIAIDKFPDSDEPCSIAVMPFMGESFHKAHYGIKFLRTWDGSDAVNPIVMSLRPFEFIKEAGLIDKSEDIVELEKMWKENFSRLNEINI